MGVFYLLQAVVTPAMEAVNRVVAVRLMMGGLDFMLAVLGAAAMAVRHFVLARVMKAEVEAKAHWREAARGA